MKVKKFLIYIFFIFLIISFTSCNREEKNKKENHKKTTKVQKIKEVKKKIPLLKVGSKIYYEKDFLEFLSDNLGDNYKNLNLSKKIMSSLFNQFIDEIVLYTYAKKTGIIISPNEIKYYLKKNKITTNAENIKQTLIRKIFIEKLFSIKLSEIKVTDKEAQSYYYKHLKLFRRPAEISLSQIVVDNEKEALKIKAELEKNVSLFPELAKKYSKGPRAKEGGDMGYFSKGELPKDIEKVVFNLNPGEISQVVKSPYGYHIFLVKKKKRKRLLAFKNVVDLIKLRIKEERSKKIIDQIKKEARKSIKVTILNNKYFSDINQIAQNPQNNKKNIQKENK